MVPRMDHIGPVLDLHWIRVGPVLDPCWILINLRISQRRFLLVDDLDVEVDETEHSEADEADLHRNKLK